MDGPYKAKVTSKGQVTIPVDLRRKMGLDPEMFWRYGNRRKATSSASTSRIRHSIDMWDIWKRRTPAPTG